MGTQPLALATDPLSRMDLGDELASHLRTLILRGELKPGDRLVESTLAQAFGTSRGPVRVAIGRLQVSGLVTVLPRRGAQVARLAPHDVTELYALRIALETLAVREASKTGTQDDWSAMAQALERLDRALEDTDRLAIGEADMRFHRMIIVTSGLARLQQAWEGFADQTLLLLSVLSSAGHDVQSSTGGHATVLEALREGRSDEAVAAMREHLELACDAVLTGLHGDEDRQPT